MITWFFARYVFYLAFALLFKTVQYVISWPSTLRKEQENCKMPENYARSAQESEIPKIETFDIINL